MSDKLRDAYSVWTEAFRAWNNNPETVGSSEDAAAVIEADRQATRAALVAEIVAMVNGHMAFHLGAVEEADKAGVEVPAISGGAAALGMLRRDIKAKWGKQ